MNAPPARSTDVLVAGAGPTGLLLAVALASLGVDVLVVDRKLGPTRESRALGIQARTLEILDQLGIVDEFLSLATTASAVSPGFERRSFGTVPIGRLGAVVSPFPGIHVLEQSRTERILTDRLTALGVTVLWGHSITGLDHSRSGIDAVVEGPGGREAVHAAYCVGADGASSFVRKRTGIPFEGITNEHIFYVADAHGVSGLPADRINVRLGTEDFLVTFPMGPGGHVRVLGTIRLTGSQEAVTEPEARARLAAVFGVEYDSTSWFSTYRISHRVAATFREGRVFLAGDAGHVHSPVGAQGMNTGLQDAHNLALKLANVLRHDYPPATLNQYDAERRPVALRLTSTTDRAFGAVTSSARRAVFIRRRLLPLVLPVAVRLLPRLPGAPRLFEYVSQVRIHYWMSEEARRTGRRGSVVGRRLPWTGTNFDVLRSLEWQVHVYGPVAARDAIRVRSFVSLPVHQFESTGNTRLVPGWFYLIRPDGFVAAEAAGGAAARKFRRALDAAGVPRRPTERVPG
ncbi:FAD-dependent monooxygenase [Mycetocola manganoxydans]|uniref:FAD-dependent monooxygenase n=1 Tax=Mycetocola manganoxydans TaxID=699879 RepID=UPI0019A4A203|nr:FAD-dependent monooxygenase [Mycetocola manganoxydans]GHD50812.1 2-polyprenyl-6-methoxyphenol hydroxylase [Mycetocola manganoxydans]